MRRPIAISLSPNTEKDDILLAFKTAISFHKWFSEEEVGLFEVKFREMFGEDFKVLTLNSGRAAEYVILKSLGIGRGDEVAIQAFTCLVVPNSIIWTGARPVYVDVDETYNIDPEDLERKISSKTKAVVVQHTFGIPAKVERVREIAKRRGLILIEDCAHSLGAEIKGRKIGTFGDISFFSLGRDKVISSVFGGAILCQSQNYYEKIKKVVSKLDFPSYPWTAQQIFHPLAMSFILPTYNLGLGKFLIFSLQKTGLLSKAVSREEKFGKRPPFFPKRFPGALAILARNQLEKLERFNSHRRKLAEFYFSALGGGDFVLPPKVGGSIWLRFPVRHTDSGEILKYAKRRGVLLGDWYRGIIVPTPNLSKVFYKMGSCPKAEMFSQTILNLPTYPTLPRSQAKKIVSLLRKWRSIKSKK